MQNQPVIDFEQIMRNREREAERRQTVKRSPGRPKGSTKAPTTTPYTQAPKNASSILAKTHEQRQYIVNEVLREGHTLFIGTMKIGKTRLLHQIALDIAHGRPVFGVFDTEQRPVLYLSLEDTEADSNDRLNDLLDGQPLPDDVIFQVFNREDKFPRIDQGGYAYIDHWLADHQHGFVVIDPYVRVRPHTRGVQYQRDYDAFDPMTELASTRQASIVSVVHTTKTRHQDIWLDATGSTGMGAAVDNALMLYGNRGEPSVHLRIDGRFMNGMEDYILSVQESGLFTMHQALMKNILKRQHQTLFDAIAQYPDGVELSTVARKLKRNLHTVRSQAALLRPRYVYNEGKLWFANYDDGNE
jgi:RecA-family ATPase